jgi:peptide chain release factor subunit 1
MTLTTDELQTLAGVRDEHAAAISVYLDLDPSLTPKPDDIQTRTGSVTDRARQQRPDDLPHEEKLAFDAAIARIEETLVDRPSWDSGVHTHGLAVFARGEDVFHTEAITRALEDEAIVGEVFSLRQLALATSRADEALVLLASRELGRLWLLRSGRLFDVFNDEEEIENRHKKGGWAQANLQRWVDGSAERHIKEVVEHLEHVYDRLGRPPIVISASEENATLVRDHMSQETAERVIGEIGNVRDFDTAQLLEAIDEHLRRADAAHEEELLERRRAQVGRAEILPSPDEALAAISDQRVEWLLLSPRLPNLGLRIFRCPRCDRLADAPGPCPLDGEQMRRDPQGLDFAVAKTLLQGGSVWQLDEPGEELDENRGIGVIIRF